MIVIKNVFNRRFTDATALKGLAKKESLKAELVDSGGDWLPIVLASIVPKLEQGLGNKIQDLQIKQQCAQEAGLLHSARHT